jgi:hypothetical protein
LFRQFCISLLSSFDLASDCGLIRVALLNAGGLGLSRLVLVDSDLMDPAAFRLAALWAGWLLVMLFHVELGLMPLFHGRSVEIESRVSASRLPQVFLAMLIYFLLPVLAMLLAFQAATDPVGWSGSALMRGLQFWFGAAYCVSNLIHLVADIRIPDSRVDQVVLMTALSLLGFLLCWQAWQWWKG